MGIDESNHGKFPEIYVSVLSTNERDVIPSNLSKLRTRIKLENIIKEIEDFRYLKISRDISDYFGKTAVRAQAISRLLIELELNPSNIFVFVDGEAKNGVVQDIIHIYNNNQNRGILERKKLQFIVQGDKIYPIINQADKLAYKLFRECERNRNYELTDNITRIPLIESI